MAGLTPRFSLAAIAYLIFFLLMSSPARAAGTVTTCSFRLYNWFISSSAREG
jgi:Ca2+/Na+ antiporter